MKALSVLSAMILTPIILPQSHIGTNAIFARWAVNLSEISILRAFEAAHPDHRAKPIFDRFFLGELVVWPRAVWISFLQLGLLTMAFAQAHSGTAPILVDEFHTGGF
jgi:hypothetical protein